LLATACRSRGLFATYNVSDDGLGSGPSHPPALLGIDHSLALGLAVVGILSRVVMKTVAARRAESQSIDDQDQHVVPLTYIGRKRFRPIPSRGLRLPDR